MVRVVGVFAAALGLLGLYGILIDSPRLVPNSNPAMFGVGVALALCFLALLVCGILLIVRGGIRASSGTPKKTENEEE